MEDRCRESVHFNMAENEEYQLNTEKELATNISDKDITQLLKQCSTFGPYQRCLFACIFTMTMIVALPAMSLSFSTTNVPFLCYPPNFNVSVIPPNITETEYLRMLQPDDDECSVYNSSFTETYYTISPSNLSKLQCSHGRMFLTDNLSTIVSEFDLVCERKWLRSTLQSVYFAGYIVGSIVFGILADRIGRRPCCLLANICATVCGVIKIFVPSFFLLMVLYSIEAFGLLGFGISIYSLFMEFTSAKLRTPLNFIYMLSFTIGSMIVTGLAYAIRDWKHLELTVCLLPAINYVIWTYIPESPRWLIGRKRFAEAQVVLRNIMKINKTHHPDILDIVRNNEQSTHENNFQENICQKTISLKEKNYSVLDLFNTFRLAMITLNICFSWFVMSMLYYGITLNSVDMAGNHYINFLLMAAVEFPCYLCSYCLLNCIGHRKPISLFMVFSGINCIISNFVTKGSFWFPMILVVLGKFGISAAFGSIYLLSAELFPTVVRSNRPFISISGCMLADEGAIAPETYLQAFPTLFVGAESIANGIGTASLFARIGSTSAPFILQLSSYVKWLPLSIFGVLSVISGILLLLLPETKDKDLPQTFEDLENWGKLHCIHERDRE